MQTIARGEARTHADLGLELEAEIAELCATSLQGLEGVVAVACAVALARVARRGGQVVRTDLFVLLGQAQIVARRDLACRGRPVRMPPKR